MAAISHLPSFFATVRDINPELRKQIESFLNTGTRALKVGMQELARQLQADIGFSFPNRNSIWSITSEYIKATDKEAKDSVREY
jgi:hypothetical protein